MSEVLFFIALGFGTGALIASLALGIVLNYRGSGGVNLAVGAVAMVAAYSFSTLKTDGYLLIEELDVGDPLGTVPAFLVTLAGAAALGAAWDVLVLRALRAAPPLAKLVASVGLLLLLEGLMVLRFGNVGQRAPSVLPDVGVVEWLGETIPGDRFVLVGLVAALTLVLDAWYRWTRFGMSTRAAAENETAATLQGLSPNRLSLANTVLAFSISAALGMLVAPLLSLDPLTITVAVIPALAAALLARLTSFWIAALAGIAMGCIQSLVIYAQTKSWFPTSGGTTLGGVPELLYFIVIVAVVFLRGSSLPERGVFIEKRLPAAPAARTVATPVIALGLVCLAALILLPFDFRQALITSLIGAVVCLSYVLITGFVGQVSLAQIALAGAAGFVVSKLGTELDIGFPLAPLAAAAFATALGLIIGVSALRVRGVNLAIVTMAAAVAIQSFGFENPTWGAGPTGSPISSPSLLGIDLGPNGDFGLGDGRLPSPVFGFLCLAVVLAVGLLVVFIRRSALGQQMLAIRSNERAAASAGIAVREVKLAAFALSSFVAGIAGALYAYSLSSVTASAFNILIGFAFVSFAYVGGITAVSGALIGGFLVTDGLGIHIIQELTGLPNEWVVIFGGAALILIVIKQPAGLVEAARTHLRAARARIVPSFGAAAPLAPGSGASVGDGDPR